MMTGSHKCEDILCTYCYNKFSPIKMNMHYRLNDGMINPLHKSVEEDKSPEEETKTESEFDMCRVRTSRRTGSSSAARAVKGKRLDEKLLKFYTERMGMSSNEAQSRAMQNDYVEFDADAPEIDYDLNEWKKYGFVESIKYNGQRVKWICPFCHNPLVSGSGKKKMLLFSVIGDTNAGKTVYFSALQRLIGDRLLYIGGDDSDDYNFFATGTRLPSSTNTKPLPSCTMMYMQENPETKENEEYILVFCDIAGENCTSEQKLKKTAFNLPNSSAILFMIDPTRFETIATIMGKKGESDEEQYKLFTAVYNFFDAGGNKLKIPTAVVITKSDVLKAHSFFSGDDDKNKFVMPYSSDDHANFVSLPIIDEVDGVTRDFLRAINKGVYVSNVDMIFENSKFFLVSSLGYDPESQGDDNAIMPNRVAEPFKWLLFENDAAFSHRSEKITRRSTGITLLNKKLDKGIFSKIKGKEETKKIDFYYKKSELKKKLESLKEEP